MSPIEIILRYHAVCRLCGHTIHTGTKALWGEEGVSHMSGQCLPPLPAWDYVLACGHIITFPSRLTTPPSVLPCSKCKRMYPIKEERIQVPPPAPSAT